MEDLKKQQAQLEGMTLLLSFCSYLLVDRQLFGADGFDRALWHLWKATESCF
jgi:hypothetical protein